ncbi:hypothetical protein [Ruminococcus sp.]|uniref:hypothetical protein n=1 Tax=Ruminococcus sp. TaxID=41978 RepID=UPI0025EA9767|nr:hypothetical protein [Ruminococcus sp.]MBQ8967454.1 hypothetical protein [Ruminococcus sp.]
MTAKKNRIIIFVFVIAAAAVVFVMLLPKKFRDKAVSEVMEKTYKTSANYTVADVNKMAGADCNTRESKLYKVSCTECYYKKEPENNYQKLRYHLFDSEKDAEKALDKLKENMSEGAEMTENSVYGYENDVMDASVELYCIRKDNMLVSASATYNTYYEKSEEEKVNADNAERGRHFDELKSWMEENF